MLLLFKFILKYLSLYSYVKVTYEEICYHPRITLDKLRLKPIALLIFYYVWRNYEVSFELIGRALLNFSNQKKLFI